ncbi:MAG: Mut7-C RNAse domain-containing protein, partial [Chloroflexi bacterium]|nr:Mut7-C RNAse domain-containing protein [Chloroflexota bacterium]
LDAHLGKLAGLLRLLGFDVLYRNDDDDETLARISAEQERILLTRDRGLLKRSIVTYGYHVWETNPGRQLVEVLRRFNLSAQISPFRRCLRCNAVLEPVSKEAVIDRLEPKTRLYYDEFAFCRACDQVYWKGSHYARLQGLIAQLTRGTGQT